ncbi:histone deacetylase family protein [Nitrosomonas sp. Nm33]|uniref:histone deacetylase family protein n=1 Tax=Nitrosomonas sp. Nm33 TaxID=133724 RepID=UPI000895466C|nr:histone deacetylase family protein [Nitrosomonas sp. Nm33]SDY54087.1 Acetoin utilization deacetylase AcuC [Nitrosomonas sp. Nm33]
MQTAYITHPACLEHNMGYDHPESPERLRAIENELIASGIFPLLQQHQAPRVMHEQLARVHSGSYLKSIETVAPQHGLISLDADTFMNPFTLEAAYRAAGAVVLATDLVMIGKVENAFCNVRPPGHHATHDQAMGFCFFNNIAVGVAHAMAQYDLKRVAIADFDVHHGNGTEDILKHDPRVMLCSTFEHPFYPFCGADSSSDHIINVPLAAGTDSLAFRSAVTQHWLPALESFQPEMIFISAGFDAHREDDMAHLNLIESDYIWVTEQIKAIADKYAQKHIVSALEGGYALHALGRSATAHIKVLCGL